MDLLSAVKEIERRLNDGLDRTEEEREKCLRWLMEYLTANDLTVKELDELCFEDSTWIFDQIFGCSEAEQSEGE